jgi:putative DNA primase/helicase
MVGEDMMEVTVNRKPEILAEALAHAQQGWHLLAMHTPLPNGRCSCNRASCTHIGKHPRYHQELLTQGVKSATNDHDLIQQWWTLWPDANLGLATGPSGLVVIDIDPRHGLNTVTAHTGGGGLHLFYRQLPGMQITCSGKNLPHGIDVKARGGIITLPPSLHVSRQRYCWKETHSPAERDVLSVPESLLGLLTVELTKLQATKSSLPAAHPSEQNMIPSGERNDHLASLAGVMRRRGMAEEAIVSALQIENQYRCNPPLPEEEVRQIAASIARYPPAVRSHNRTDVGNAKRLVELHGSHIRYCYSWRRWLVWDKRRWCVDTTGQIFRFAKDTVRSIYQEAEEIEDEGVRKEMAKWALLSESDRHIRSMISQAESEHSIPITPDQLDSDPWLLNCLNGTVNLRTGELHSHSPNLYISMLAPVKFDLDASAPQWMKFINRILGEDEEMITFLQRAIGYSLTGMTGERVMFLLWGGGGNGKTVLLEVIRSLLGEYAMRTPVETLMARRSSAIPNDVARLKGARFVTASESEGEQRLAEAQVKDLTGGDTIAARFLHQEWFEFRPEFKLWIATNHIPVIKGTDDGIWDRVRLIPFTMRIPQKERDQQLVQKLRDELSGILAWAVKGCLDWQQHGLGLPTVVAQATQTYRAEMDEIGQFLADCCIQKLDVRVSVADLYSGYQQWCINNGRDRIRKHIFGMLLREKNFDQSKSGATRYWLGLVIKPDL